MADRTRKYPGVSGRRPDKVVARREIEAERLEWWRSLTPARQLAELDRRLGKGVGATRQRARLESLLRKTKPSQEPPKAQETEAQPRKGMKAKDRRRAEKKRSG